LPEHILHISGNLLSRVGMASIITEDAAIAGIDHARSVEEAKEKFNAGKYALVILSDQYAPAIEKGILAHIKTVAPNQRVLMISETDDARAVLAKLEQGVDGYLTRECDRNEIIHAVYAIIKGERFYCNKVLNILVDRHLMKDDPEDCSATALTQRETDITRLIAEGRTSKEIASRLHISQHTVQTHRKNIMRKLKMNSVSELTLYAVNTGLIATTK
jgi:DNA-binding NarL/FixJ family response regulator